MRVYYKIKWSRIYRRLYEATGVERKTCRASIRWCSAVILSPISIRVNCNLSARACVSCTVECVIKWCRKDFTPWERERCDRTTTMNYYNFFLLDLYRICIKSLVAWNEILFVYKWQYFFFFVWVLAIIIFCCNVKMDWI